MYYVIWECQVTDENKLTRENTFSLWLMYCAANDAVAKNPSGIILIYVIIII